MLFIYIYLTILMLDFNRFLLQPIATIVEGLEEKSKTLEKKIDSAQVRNCMLHLICAIIN